MFLKHKISILLLVISFLVSACETTDLEKIKALANKEELPDVIIENLQAIYSLNGNTQVKLVTPKAYKFNSETKQYTLFPDGLNLMFYDNNFNLHSSLTSNYGIYYEKKRFAKASGNVILTNVNGSVLKTDFTVYRFTDVSGEKIIQEDENNDFFSDNDKENKKEVKKQVPQGKKQKLNKKIK